MDLLQNEHSYVTISQIGTPEAPLCAHNYPINYHLPLKVTALLTSFACFLSQLFTEAYI